MNRRTLLLAAPLGVAAAAGASFYVMLDRMRAGRFDPRGVPSMLIGKKVPDFALPGQAGPGFASADLAAGRVVVVNFFASWCEPCIAESAVLLGLKQAGVPLYGIAYKDATAATTTFLKRHGDPYARLARDQSGTVAIDWGLTGVPETYVVDGKGIVRYRFVGPLTPEIATGELPEVLRKYAA